MHFSTLNSVSRRSLWAKSGRTLDPSNPLRNWHPINSRQFSHLFYSRRQCTKPEGGTTSPTSASSADQFKSRPARNSFPHNASSSSSSFADPAAQIPTPAGPQDKTPSSLQLSPTSVSIRVYLWPISTRPRPCRRFCAQLVTPGPQPYSATRCIAGVGAGWGGNPCQTRAPVDESWGGPPP